MIRRRSRGDGSLFQRKNGYWVAQITLPSGKRKQKYTKTKREAREWLQKKRTELSEGTLVANEKLTVGEFLEQWFEDVAKPSLRPSTIVTHGSIIRLHIKPALGSIRLTRLTPMHLQHLYARKLKSNLSNRTVKYIHSIIHQMLAQALKWGLVGRNVAQAVEAPKPVRKSVSALTQEQTILLLETLRSDRLLPLYLVYLGCGLRRGEALALTKDCIDWQNGLIHIRKTLSAIPGEGLVVGEPKSESSRRPVAMPDFVRRALSDHLANRKVDSDYIFCTANGTPFSPRNIVRHFKRTLRKAGLPQHFRIHDLRHTFVSLLLAQNVPPKDVQVIAGHADFSTTMNIYGHLMPGAHKEAARKLDRLFKYGPIDTA
jgi:integrase